MRDKGHRSEEDQNVIKPKGFNIQVTYRNEKTGLVTHSDPYTLRVVSASDGKTKMWERPTGSGNLFNSKNEPIGRWVIDPKTKRGTFQKDAAHIEFTPPETKDQKLARSLTEKENKIQALEKELQAIKAETKKADKKE